MEALEILPKTLAEHCSLASEQPQPQSPEHKALTEASYGVDSGHGVAEVVTNRVGEAEMSFGKSLGDRKIDVSGVKEGVLEESEMKGSCSLMKMRESGKEFEIENGAGSESVKGLGSVLGVDLNEEMSADKVAGDDSLSGDVGVSLVVDLSGAMHETYLKEIRVLRENSRREENGDSLCENGKALDGKIEELSEMVVEPIKNEVDVAVEGTHLGKPASAYERKERKASDEADCHGGKNLTKVSQDLNRTKLPWPPIVTKSNVSNGGGGKEETHSLESIEGKKNGVASEQAEKGFASRKRKKSRYLSPPYTSLNWRQLMRDLETESLKVSGAARVRVPKTKVAGCLMGSPPVLKCSGETFQEQNSKECRMGCETSDNSSAQTPPQGQNMIIDPMKVPLNDVLSEIRSVALNPVYPEDHKSLDMVEGFLSAVRSSVYRKGSNYKMYNKQQRGRKRTYLDSETGSYGKDENQTDNNALERESKRRRIKKNKETKLAKLKLEQDIALPGKVNEILLWKASSLSNEGHMTLNSSASRSSVGKALQFNFMRHQLEMMTSKLESETEISPELKSKLESEVKGLLEKVSAMAGSSTS